MMEDFQTNHNEISSQNTLSYIQRYFDKRGKL